VRNEIRKNTNTRIMTHSQTKQEFPTIEDLMFKNKSAINRHKRQKYFAKVKPFKKFKYKGKIQL